jgi:hypothetical protein
MPCNAGVDADDDAAERLRLGGSSEAEQAEGQVLCRKKRTLRPCVSI